MVSRGAPPACTLDTIPVAFPRESEGLRFQIWRLPVFPPAL